MKKEQVTIHHITKDLTCNMYRDIVQYPLAIALLCIIIETGIEMINISLPLDIPHGWSLILFVFLIYIVPSICLKYDEMKKAFIIRKDIVVSRREAKDGGKYTFYRPYRLTFKYGHFDISHRKYYKWSPRYAMKDKELYESTYIGDTFTIIEFKNETLLVFNDKLFDVQVCKQ